MTSATPSVNSDDTGQTPPAVLFFADNGKGLGHLTRLLAIARQARGRFTPVVFTMSLGYEILRSQRVPAEFFPAYHQLGLTKDEWVPLLKARLAEAIRNTGARVVVVDHVTPPKSFDQLRSETTGVQWIWSRRALWRRGRNEGALGLAAGFDQVVEPGDLAAPIDVGASISQKRNVRSVDPIVLVPPANYVPRREARVQLGIPEEGRAVLLNLGAPDAESLARMFQEAKEAIRSVGGGQEQVHLFAPLHPLHGDRLETIDDVIFAPVYPVARYLRAFDGAISMSGYNSFHEIVSSGLPAVFIPHSATNVDDQERRARYGELIGRAHWAPTTSDDRFREVTQKLLDLGEREVARRVTELVGPLSGAAQFADLIAEAVERVSSAPVSVPEPTVDEETRSLVSHRMHSRSRNRQGRRPLIALLACLDHTTEELAKLTTQLRSLQRSRPGLTPVVLISRASPGPLVEGGFVFESIMSAEAWAVTEGHGTYADYIEGRLARARDRYSAAEVISLAPGDDPETRISGVPEGSGSVFARADLSSFRLALPSTSQRRSRYLSIEVPSDLSIPRQLKHEGLAGYEPESLACWMAILSRSEPGAALDVGANVGPYAWLAAALTSRQVCAFEPVPKLVRALAAVSQQNGLGIRVEELALADRDGVGTLFLSDRSDSSNSLLQGFRRSSETIQVDVAALDSYLEEAGVVPHAIKIDTETTEPEVLAGARITLAAHRPWLIVEVLAQRSEDLLQEVIEPLGYSWYRIDDGFPLHRADTIAGDARHRQMNWLFAPIEPDNEFWDSVQAWREAFRSCKPDLSQAPTVAPTPGSPSRRQADEVRSS